MKRTRKIFKKEFKFGMAYMLIEFTCKDCTKVQEQFITNKNQKAEDPCKVCGAEPKKLKANISNSAHGKHVTWSKWSV